MPFQRIARRSRGGRMSVAAGRLALGVMLAWAPAVVPPAPAIAQLAVTPQRADQAQMERLRAACRERGLDGAACRDWLANEAGTRRDPEAISRAIDDPGSSVAKVCRDRGLAPAACRKWVAERRAEAARRMGVYAERCAARGLSDAQCRDWIAGPSGGAPSARQGNDICQRRGLDPAACAERVVEGTIGGAAGGVTGSAAERLPRGARARAERRATAP